MPERGKTNWHSQEEANWVPAELTREGAMRGGELGMGAKVLPGTDGMGSIVVSWKISKSRLGLVRS